MSRIQKMREALERIEAKIKFYEGLKEGTKDLKSVPSHKGIKEEVVKELGVFIDSQINKLEENALPSTNIVVETKPPIDFNAPLSKSEKTPTKPVPKSKADRNRELLEFVKKYHKFSGKKVTGKKSDGEQVTGIVKIVNFPEITVEQEGFLHSLNPETIKLA